MCKLERFSFDVACMQCGHPHSHQQVPFACVMLHVAFHVSCVDWALWSHVPAVCVVIVVIIVQDPPPPP